MNENNLYSNIDLNLNYSNTNSYNFENNNLFNNDILFQNENLKLLKNKKFREYAKKSRKNTNNKILSIINENKRLKEINEKITKENFYFKYKCNLLCTKCKLLFKDLSFLKEKKLFKITKIE